MCGRFSFVMEDELIRERFGIRVRTAIYKARYNCSPTQNLAVITNLAPDTLQFFRWGLVPSWAKELSIGNKMINARAEGIAEKPSFRTSFRNRRCLVPATGFFEWRRNGKKTPYNIRLKNSAPFCFAGLWDEWTAPDGMRINTFSIVTTTPNDLMKRIHDRMPVILRQEDEGRWINPQPDPSLLSLLVPYPAEMMEAYPVSNLVNSPSNDVPEVLGTPDDHLLFKD
ncbi:MAG: SOS response-associated peptidase [Bacteroidales bacterium]|nr:SOS response-associated peptidase [Bacteroidales bacterium]